ncbi:MAG TPA: hypothetical protein VGB99_17975 [Acidobacteriota bacterium]
MSEAPDPARNSAQPGHCLDCCYFHHGDAEPIEQLLAPCLHSQLIDYQLTVWGGGGCNKFKARP